MSYGSRPFQGQVVSVLQMQYFCGKNLAYTDTCGGGVRKQHECRSQQVLLQEGAPCIAILGNTSYLKFFCIPMKILQFIKQACTIAVGFVLALCFLLVVLLVGLSQLISTRAPYAPSTNTVLEVCVSGRVVEAISSVSLIGPDPGLIELKRLKNAIYAAANDAHIKAIYLKLSDIQSGWPALQEVHAALLAFKAKGKKVVAYADYYSQKTYYLASVSDEIVLNPSGFLAFKGLSVTVDFYTKLFEHIAVDPVVFRIGAYKSAVEPFCLTKMSPESRKQLQVYLDHAYDCFLQHIASARSVSVPQLKAFAQDLSAVLPEDARKATLITKVGYDQATKNDLKQYIQEAYGTSNPVFMSYQQYAVPKTAPTVSHKIAIVVAEGEIVDGPTAFGCVGARDFVKTVQAIQADTTIKAVVLRINSPGGDVLASDNMCKAIEELKSVKPVVASMSDMAASGGYYIATPCSYIFAQPTTLTGSIGIFTLFFDPAKLMHKIGIERDVVKTAPSADFLQPRTTCSEAEKTFLYKMLRQYYNIFLAKVAQGRNLTPNQVAQIASGRIFSGAVAQKNGLVDQLGGIESAIEKAASLAQQATANCNVVYFHLPKTKLEALWQCFGSSLHNKAFSIFAQACPWLHPFQYVPMRPGVKAMLPYVVSVE